MVEKLSMEDLHDVVSDAVHDAHRRSAADEELMRQVGGGLVRHGWNAVVIGIKRWVGGLTLAVAALAIGSALAIVVGKLQGWIK